MGIEIFSRSATKWAIGCTLGERAFKRICGVKTKKMGDLEASAQKIQKKILLILWQT